MTEQGLNLKLEREWYKIRDYMTGQNGKEFNLVKAFELAKKSQHPDAKWLVSVVERQIFERRISKSKLQFMNYLDYLVDECGGDGDPRTLCFSGRVKKAAYAGYPYAMFHAAKAIPDFLNNPLLLKERLALCDYAEEFGQQYHCDPLTFVELSAKLDCGAAYDKLACCHSHVTNQLWHWICKAAKRGFFSRFYYTLGHYSSFPFPPTISNQTIYEIGSVCAGIKLGVHGRLNTRDGVAFKYVLNHFHERNKLYMDAVQTWSLIGLRLKVCKDLRIYIGKMIWKGRKEDY
jgi:hypothetical protein